jgi:MATE family multidrug resistance protein
MNLTFPSQYNFVPRYFRLALANVLSNIMVPLANLVSIMFLGHLSEIHILSPKNKRVISSRVSN